MKSEAMICGLRVSCQRNRYDGLWYIRYDDGMQWGGPFKTKREAMERLEREDDAPSQ